MIAGEELLTVLHSLKCAITFLCGESGVSISISSDSNSSVKTPHKKNRRVSQNLSVQANSVYNLHLQTGVAWQYREQYRTAGPFQAEPAGGQEFFYFFYYDTQLQRNAVSVCVSDRAKPILSILRGDMSGPSQLGLILVFLDIRLAQRRRSKEFTFGQVQVWVCVNATETDDTEVKCAVQAKVCELISNSSESKEELTESDETQPVAKKPRSDSQSASAIAVLFGEDYNLEISDTTELNQYCQDMCPSIHIDSMS
ncbi:unnamed protein product [Leuciscus chuanchicus]